MAKRAARGSESRTEVITVRLTKAERVRIEHRAAAGGLTVSAWAAQVLARGQVTVEAKPAAVVLPPELIAEFKRIGNNLNQIAHALNARMPADHARLPRLWNDFISAILRDQYLQGRAAPFAKAILKSQDRRSP